jgi:hypothetical protein
MPARLSTLLVAFVAIALALPASAIVIDDFESGDFLLNDDGTSPAPTFAEQAAGVVGGVRLVSASADGGPADVATASLTTSGGPDSLLLSYGSFTQAAFTLTYDGIPGGTPNLTPPPPGTINPALAAAGGILFEVGATTAGATVNAYLYSTFLFDGVNQTTAFLHIHQTGPVAISAGYNSIYFDYSSFLGLLGPINPADIHAIRFQIQNVAPGNTLAIQNISSVIPEPGTAALLAMGLVGMAARRKVVR